jgi:hypothetical protein
MLSDCLSARRRLYSVYVCTDRIETGIDRQPGAERAVEARQVR